MDPSIKRALDVSIRPRTLVAEARELLADGAHPEYERAIAELLVRALGLSHDIHEGAVRKLLGL